LTKKQIKALKKEVDSKLNLGNNAIKDGMDEITIQYTRILKHLRVHSEILIDHKKLKSPSKHLRSYLNEWQKNAINHNEIMNSPNIEREMTLKEIKRNYDQILNIGTCRCLLGLNPESKEFKKAKVTAFDRFSVYHDFYKEELARKFTKSDIRSLLKRSIDLGNYKQKLHDIDFKEIVEVSHSGISMAEKGKEEILTEKDFINLSYFTIDFIKQRIGVKTNNYNDYKLILDEKGINRNKIFYELLSEHNVTSLLEQARIQDKPDIRKNPQGPSKNRKRGLDCILVVALMLLKCNNYDCLRNFIKIKKNIQEKQARNIIKNYVPILRQLNSNFEIEKWLPGASNYNFIKTQKLVEDVGLKKTGKKGILLSPESEEEFEFLRKQLNIKPTQIPLAVRCGNCGYQWSTAVNKINQRNGKWCRLCGIDIYTFNKTKKLVKSTGLYRTGKEGKLINPRNEGEYNEIKEQLNCWYCRIPLDVECGSCGNFFSTNAERLQQNHWCPKCAKGLYEQICRWYLERILSYTFKLKVICPQTRLNEVISHYDKSKYNKDELNDIENLIKFGHLDCYYEIFINRKCKKLALEYQGGQHEKKVSKFHNTEEDLKHQKLLDKLKRELCIENNIILLEFPYFIDKYMNNNEVTQEFLVKELATKAKIGIPKDLPLYNHNTPEFGQYRLTNFL
jgi:hypothetical protein